MSKNLFAAALVALLFVSAALNAYYALQLFFSTRQLRRVQPQVVEIQNRLTVARALLNDTLEYSKRNPAIDPLLQSLNFKTNVAAAESAVPKPAVK